MRRMQVFSMVTVLVVLVVLAMSAGFSVIRAL